MAEGVVKWFDTKKGFGFITPESGNGDIFVHFSGIKANGFRNLKEGDRVRFELNESEKGLKASEVEAI